MLVTVKHDISFKHAMMYDYLIILAATSFERPAVGDSDPSEVEEEEGGHCYRRKPATANAPKEGGQQQSHEEI